MLRAYIYNSDQDNWLEEENLLYHDICAILDEEKRIIYLWKGPQSSKQRFQRGHRALNKLMTNYKKGTLKMQVLEENAPTPIQEKIGKMLEMMKEAELAKGTKFSRLTTIKGYYYISLIEVILPFVLLLNFIGLTFLPWDGSGNIQVNAALFDAWIVIALSIITIMGIGFLLLMITGFYEGDLQAGLYASASLVVSIGLYLYISQGEFLFVFQKGTTIAVYVLAVADLWRFIAIMAGVAALIEIPTLFKFLKFKKDYVEFLTI